MGKTKEFVGRQVQKVKSGVKTAGRKVKDYAGKKTQSVKAATKRYRDDLDTAGRVGSDYGREAARHIPRRAGASRVAATAFGKSVRHEHKYGSRVPARSSSQGKKTYRR